MAIWKVKRRWHGVAIRMWEPRRGWINNFCDTCDRLRTGLCEREGNFLREERRERYTQWNWEMEVKRESRWATVKVCIIFPSSCIKPHNRQTVSDFTLVSDNKAFDNKVLTPQEPGRRGTQGQGQQGERGRERRGFFFFLQSHSRSSVTPSVSLPSDNFQCWPWDNFTRTSNILQCPQSYRMRPNIWKKLNYTLHQSSYSYFELGYCYSPKGDVLFV